MATEELQALGQAPRLLFKDKAGNSFLMVADMTGQSPCADRGSAVSRSLIPVCLWGPEADTPADVFLKDYQTRKWTQGGGLGQPAHTFSERMPTGSN